MEATGSSSQRLELELCGSWIIPQKLARGTKNVVVFAAFGYKGLLLANAE
jgi:hypothetical protein